MSIHFLLKIGFIAIAMCVCFLVEIEECEIRFTPKFSVLDSDVGVFFLNNFLLPGRMIHDRTGAIYISVSEALTSLMFEAVPCQLSKEPCFFVSSNNSGREMVRKIAIPVRGGILNVF